jgi:HAD superfamily hydrolase (TIGR01509 family)
MRNTILWDHDGVLVDTERLYYHATRDVLAPFGVDLSLEQYKQFHLVGAYGSWHLLTALGVEPETVKQLRRERNEIYRRMLIENDVMAPGAIDLLRRLKARYRMAIVTSSERVHFDAIHDRTELREQVDFVLTREDCAECKPDPEPYLRAVELFRARHDECLVVEDSERGLIAAKAAGLACWTVYSDMTEGQNFAAADRRFANLTELGDALMITPAC